MAAPSRAGGRAPGQREHLPRKKKSFRIDFRVECYERLRELPRLRNDGQPESLAEVVERLIMSAPQPTMLPFSRG
jgi:hypothetical protein